MLRRMSLRSVPIPSQKCPAAFAVSIDGRTAFFFDQVANSVYSLSTVDGCIDCFYQMPPFAYQYAAKPKTWLSWAASFFVEVEPDWKAIRFFCNKSTGLVGFFWNATSRTLHTLLFHANRKLKQLVLLDSSQIDLPHFWGSVEPSVQQVDGDYAVVITYTIASDPMRRFLIIRCSVDDGHIDTRPKLTHPLPAGIWSCVGEHNGRVRLLLWNKKSMIEMTARGWEEIELSPDGDTRQYPPPDDDCHCALPVIRNGRAWFCIFDSQQNAENIGCLWQLDLARHRWNKYPTFPVVGSAYAVMRKLRNAIELIVVDGADDKQTLQLITFIQTGSPAQQNVLTCPVCYQLFKEPVKLTCGHAVCAQCLAKVASNERKLKCVICGMEMSPNDLAINLALKEIVLELLKEAPRTTFCEDCGRPSSSADLMRCLTCHPYGNNCYCALCLLKLHSGHQIDFLPPDTSVAIIEESSNNDFFNINFVP